MKKYILWFLFLICGFNAFAHPMPHSLVELSLLEGYIKGEARIPLPELGNAVGEQRVAHLEDPFFAAYFKDHIQAVSAGKPWTTEIQSIRVIEDEDPAVGTYEEVLVRFTLTPSDGSHLRSFRFDYDVVLHQVVTHSALVYLKQDWKNGILKENAEAIGVIGLDIRTEKVMPLEVNLETGSSWKGFTHLFFSGMRHIREGTDHLLFLIVLLLPAMLRTKGKRWQEFGGNRYSAVRLLKIITAFTLGHSITLLAGAAGGLNVPGQPVEILIAVSLFVSALHAVRPLFSGREAYVAGGFGLIHGLAFASVLSPLSLTAGQMAWSILGFNLGIEVAQLFIVSLILPWLILLSKTPSYKWFRIAGAALSAIASLAWIAERGTGKGNIITRFAQTAALHGEWLILSLALLSMLIFGATAYAGRKERLVS